MIHLLQNRNVKWYTDNKNVEHIVNKGNMKGHLQSFAWDIYNDCIKHGISLEIEWVPRTDNDYVRLIMLARLSIKMIGQFQVISLTFSTGSGGHIPLTGLPLIIILNCQDLLPAFGTQTPWELMPLASIGRMKITG